MLGSRKGRLHVLPLMAVLLLALVVVVAVGCGSSTTTTTTAASTATTAASTTTTVAATGTSSAESSTSTSNAYSASNPATGKARHIIIESAYYTMAEPSMAFNSFKKDAEAVGWTVDIVDSNQDIDKLNANWETAISQKPDAIIDGEMLTGQITKSLQDAKAAGIPVFTYDGDISPLSLCNVQSDNTALGTQMMELLAKAIGYKGNVIIYSQDGQPAVRLRGLAAQAVCNKYGIKWTEYQPEPATGLDWTKTNMTDRLTANPTPGSISGVFTSWADPAVGASEACQADKRYEVKIVGQDADEGEMEQMLLPQPNEIASMSQDTDGQSAKLLQLMIDDFNGTPPAQNNYQIPGKIIDTTAKAQAYLTYLKSIFG